ncbi:hypothetical protein CEXT_323491 [Caerostris extrusa]|uniref:Uncharacterized protein n=1 Tax=Caerostris extrusa TaxID=172846 RepID=A0AAV4SAM9_CAEEX|nr:hypothetical protein CEXT_323491 [Caerostris extrusa]
MLAHACYASLNGCSSRVAERNGSVFGFSELQEVAGRRVLGVAHATAASTTILLDPTACVDAPDGWSLEEAASVPDAYIAPVELVHWRGCSGAGRGDWSGCCSYSYHPKASLLFVRILSSPFLILLNEVFFYLSPVEGFNHKCFSN